MDSVGSGDNVQPIIEGSSPDELKSVPISLKAQQLYDFRLEVTKLALEVKESDVKNMPQTLREEVPPTPPNHIRLKSDALEDLLFVAHYSVK